MKRMRNNECVWESEWGKDRDKKWVSERERDSCTPIKWFGWIGHDVKDVMYEGSFEGRMDTKMEPVTQEFIFLNEKKMVRIWDWSGLLNIFFK